MLAWILGFSLASALMAMIGGLILLARHQWARFISIYLLSFAAGALLGAAFLGLLPEAFDQLAEVSNGPAPGWLVSFSLLGMLIFFALEKLLLWWHYHSEAENSKHHSGQHQRTRLKPSYKMVLLGDGLHNAIDGIVIALAFLVEIPAGIAAGIAVIFHELPQEIGDFGILIHAGLSRTKILLYNLLVALTTPLAAVITFFAGSFIEGYMAHLLALAAGGFIYIAASDLIPEIHRHHQMRRSVWQVLVMLLGVGVVWLIS